MEEREGLGGRGEGTEVRGRVMYGCEGRYGRGGRGKGNVWR